MRGASAWDVRAGAGDSLAQRRALRHLGPRLFPKVGFFNGKMQNTRLKERDQMGQGERVVYILRGPDR
eukprot:2043252-Prymnesium_polylepis.1